MNNRAREAMTCMLPNILRKTFFYVTQSQLPTPKIQFPHYVLSKMIGHCMSPRLGWYHLGDIPRVPVIQKRSFNVRLAIMKEGGPVFCFV